MLYQNNEVAPFDAEFQRQIQQYLNQNILSPQYANMISADWQARKMTVIGNLKIRKMNLGGYNTNDITNVVHNFIAQGIQIHNNMAQTAMNQYNMCQNPNYYGYQQPGMMYPQPTINMQNQNFVPITCNMGEQTNTNVQQSVYDEIPQNTKTDTKEIQHQVKKESNFIAPVADEPDVLYGTERKTVSLGSIQLISLRDSVGLPIKYVNIDIVDPCKDEFEVLYRAKSIYKQKHLSHIDITYKLLKKINIPYKVAISVFTELKKVVNSVPKSSGLKYLQGILKILNNQSRGVADTIDALLCDLFINVASTACCESDISQENKLQIDKFSDIVELSDKDSPNINCQEWQKCAGFNENFEYTCDATIRKFLENIVVFDPNNRKDLSWILRANIGLIEADNNTLVDVPKEINSHINEFVTLSDDERVEKYGSAASEIINTTVVGIQDCHLTLTNFVPEGIAEINKNGAITFSTGEMFTGGCDNTNKPSPISSNFEYFITQYSMANRNQQTVIVNYGDVYIRCNCVRCADKWISISTKQ